MQNDMLQEMLKIVPSILEISEKDNAAIFTEKELRDLLAFQES